MSQPQNANNGGGGGDVNPPPVNPPPVNPPPVNPPPANDEISQAEANAATSVRLPIPKISHDNIELWFIQLDHWFTVNRITSDNTRFSTVIAALDANLLQQIFETVRNPPPVGKYEAVKTAVIHNFTESEQRRAQLFVSGLQLGDKKPSHLLNDLRRIGGEAQDEKLLKVLWMNRLPTQVQTCLAAVPSPLNALAVLADSVMETFRVGTSNENINAVQATTSNVAAASSSAVATNNVAKSNDSDALTKLTAQITKLTKEIGRLHQENANRRSRSGNRSTSTTRPRSGTPAPPSTSNNSGENDERCWYHQTYGDEAVKCRPECPLYPKN